MKVTGLALMICAVLCVGSESAIDPGAYMAWMVAWIDAECIQLDKALNDEIDRCMEKANDKPKNNWFVCMAAAVESNETTFDFRQKMCKDKSVVQKYMDCVEPTSKDEDMWKQECGIKVMCDRGLFSDNMKFPGMEQPNCISLGYVQIDPA